MTRGRSIRRHVAEWADRLKRLARARRRTGHRGERAAEKHLKSQGYRILARNLRNRYGEIDLLALTPNRNTLVVIEVKAADNNSDHPERRVNQAKQKRLVALAAQIARQYGLQHMPIRFDVIAVNFTADARPIVRHIPAAFQSHV
ncbi:MAG: hypothetical protein Kow00105_01750 [Phycisphaeraceae bacterium]